jgi:hypothetical protein
MQRSMQRETQGGVAESVGLGNAQRRQSGDQDTVEGWQRDEKWHGARVWHASRRASLTLRGCGLCRSSAAVAMVAIVILTVCTQPAHGGLFEFFHRDNNTKGTIAPPVKPPHFEKKLQGNSAPNITLVKQAWYTDQEKRWDNSAGGEIDGMLKDDGPVQLRNAMIVLCGVAGTVICCGACGIVCLWTNRERGWSSHAKLKKQKVSVAAL